MEIMDVNKKYIVVCRGEVKGKSFSFFRSRYLIPNVAIVLRLSDMWL